jgi:peptidoglycan hydrolase CwlO-like protein
MSRRVLLATLLLAVAMSAACSFSVGDVGYEFDKSSPLVIESNKLNTDASALLQDALAKYSSIYDQAQKAEDPFEELGAQSDAFKKLEPQLDSAKDKLRDASQKLGEAAKLKLPDYYTQYLTNLSEINKSGSETADLILQMVKNTYDPSIGSPEDLDAKQKVVQDKLTAAQKRRDELQTANKKIEAEHKEAFSK